MDGDDLFSDFDDIKDEQEDNKPYNRGDELYNFLTKKRKHSKDNNTNDNNEFELEIARIKAEEEKEELYLISKINELKNVCKKNNDNNEFEDNNENDILKNDCLNTEFKIKSHRFEGGYHEIVYPIGYEDIDFTDFENDSECVIKDPARIYPFKLDAFQLRAILCIEKGRSVLVSAHTSAGKTAVAEYAIALSKKNKQRVIYTSPIKALSNQKYRELKEIFGDVGLVTGDVTINPGAGCIVMTTEILRNMIYKGSEKLKEIKWVIFDEVHYMRDKSRGVVWEETMVLLSNKIKYVFLSATIPNAREFAIWICKIKEQPCDVIYTEFRPVPLKHYAFPSGGENLILIADEKKNFKEGNFNKALSEIKLNAQNDDKNKTNSPNSSLLNTTLSSLFPLLISSSLTPCVVFAFSRERARRLSILTANLERGLLEAEEEAIASKIYFAAVAAIGEEDIDEAKELWGSLSKGIGVHHGGMLPILREAVELLFQSGLIKILFATETFSMGLNMPAKTVIFTEIEKFDGNKKRMLTSGEFIQMSGRAGRRGLDERGTVVIILNKKTDSSQIKGLISNKSDLLLSSFSLSYNQILNMSRIDGVKSEAILKQSFRQFQSSRMLPELRRKVIKMYEEEYRGFERNMEKDKLVKSLLNSISSFSYYKELNRKYIFDNSKTEKKLRKFLIKGRLIEIKDFGIGIIHSFSKKNERKIYEFNEESKVLEEKYRNIENIKDIKDINDDWREKKIIENLDDFDVLNVLIPTNKSSTFSEISYFDIINPNNIDNIEKCILKIVPIKVSSLNNLSNICIKLPELNEKNNEKIVKILFSVLKGRIKDNNMEYFDFVNSFNIDDKGFLDNNEQINSLFSCIHYICQTLTNKYDISIPIENISKINIKSILDNTYIQNFKQKQELKNEIKAYLKEIDNLNNIVMQKELNNMKNLLKSLDYLSKENELITIKGQTACFITSVTNGNEILLVELIFNGYLNTLSETELLCTLSCFIGTETGESEMKKEKEKVEKEEKYIQIHKKLSEYTEWFYEILCKYNIYSGDKEKYCKRFNYSLMRIFDLWSSSEKIHFSELIKEASGGTVVRAIRRADELLKELSQGAAFINNENLRIKCENLDKSIRKGVPFAASLYLVEDEG